MTDLCFGQSTVIAVAFMVGWPTAAACFGAMAISRGRGRIWPWWIIIAAMALGCAALAIAIDQPSCRLQRDIAKLQSDISEFDR